MKRKNILRTFAAVIATVLMVTSVGNYTALAEEGEAPSSENTSVEEEKELLSCCDDWIIFRTMDEENGTPVFEVRYLEKTVDELAAENYSMQYRTIYKNEDEFKLVTSSWYNWEDTLPESTKEDIRNNKDKYYIQFQVLDNADVSLSKSETLLIWPQENPFPYILSSNIDYCEIYDLRSEPYSFSVELKYSDKLNSVDTCSIYENFNIESYLLSGSSYREILNIKNYSETVEIENKKYTINYCILSFDLQVSSMCSMEDVDSVLVNYVFTINGLQGASAKNNISNFMLNISTPTYSSTDDTVYVENIELSAPSTSVKPGDTIALTADILPEDATNQTLEWFSSNEDYATVDANGIVTTKSAGAGKTVTITAFSTDDSGVYAKFVLSIENVENNPPAVYPVTGITVTSSSNSVVAGKSVALAATVAPSNATNKKLMWSSSNDAYASVDQNGVVTTKAAGANSTVIITAEATDGSGVSASYVLQIKPIPVTGITITAPVSITGRMVLTATVSPSNAENQTLIWSSSNPDLATVDQCGMVEIQTFPQNIKTFLKQNRTVTITAKATDGSGVSGSYTFKIEPTLVSKVTVTSPSKTVEAGHKLKLKVQVSPSKASHKGIAWSSSNTKYATVSSKGVVTTKKAGAGKTVTITASSKDGSGKKASIRIKINKIIKVKKVSFPTKTKTVKAGKKITLKPIISPSNATYKTIRWITSNKKYATVNSKGVVTTKKAGKGKTVTIKIESQDGSKKTATIKIKIK